MSETIAKRIQAMTEKTAEITRRHHEELSEKDKQISELREALRIANLELIKANCKTERAKTYQESAEIESRKRLRQAKYFASKLLKMRNK
jgi:uncharacterized protein YeaO (DUF488 family)